MATNFVKVETAVSKLRLWKKQNGLCKSNMATNVAKVGYSSGKIKVLKETKLKLQIKNEWRRQHVLLAKLRLW